MNPLLRRTGTALAVLVLLTTTVRAEKPVGEKVPLASQGEIEDFRIPERDGQGNLRWLIQGQRGKIIQEGRIEIYSVRVETYQDGKIDNTMTSPQCTLVRETIAERVATHVESDHPVEISGPHLHIKADGFQWFPDTTRMVLRKNVEVLFERKKGRE